MSILARVVDDLRDVEVELHDHPALAQRIREIARLLETDEAQWIGTTAARRLLGVRSENTVKAWAWLGILRSRREPNGRIKVSLDDVLARRVINTDLAGDGDNRELSPEERQVLARPLSPAEREELTTSVARLGVVLPPAEGDTSAAVD